MLKPACLALTSALISAAVCLAQAPSTAPKKGSVSGTVTNVAGEPVRGATLRLIPQKDGAGTPAQVDSVSSDAQGNFAFEDLDPGSYSVTSEKAGYLSTEYFDSAKSWVFDLASGEKRTGIDIKMTPQSLISGRVTDEYGDPYPNARVSVVRWGYEKGQKRPQPAGGPGALTNAEGVFALGNLQAGSYYIEVTPRSVSTYPAPIQKGQEEAFVTTYYPGVTDPSSAIAVQASAGGAARDIDIRMHKARAYRIHGKVAGVAAGTSPPNITVQIVPKDGPSLNPASAVVRDGAFDFEGVLPGIYMLQSIPGPRTSGMARQIVTLGNADVDDLVLQFGPGAEITGTISTEGTAPLPQQRQPRPAVQLIPTEGTGGVGSNPQAADDGTFAIHNIMPAIYQVQVQPLPPGTYVKSIRFGSQDLMKTALDLTSGSGGAMNVVLSANAGDIGGNVRGADGRPVPNVFVTLWTPGVPAEGVADFTRTASSDTKGQFKFAGLPPGEYRIAAWEQIDPGLGTAPEFRIKFESKAATVRLDENAHENIEAPLIGRDAVEAEAAKLQ
jgi:protocatechuate 3,4-dioxygenase beta subunit